MTPPLTPWRRRWSVGVPTKTSSSNKALAHKDRLLSFDREAASRTKIYDAQADYYSNTTSTWLTADEQAEAGRRDEAQQRALHEREKNSLDLSKILT